MNKFSTFVELNNLKPLFRDDFKELPIVMAGPCSAESEQQVLSTARQLAAEGIKIYRAGVWKPRTKPGGFEGIGAPALTWLARVKQETGMLIATEVANERHLREALDAGIDIVWVGARTSANPFAVQEIADHLQILPEERKNRLTVLVKNPVNPDLELWIGALERIRRAGITRLGAIHRGFSAYGKHVYRNDPMWRIPIELHRRIPSMPILCDPSHIGGKREFIGPLSQQALDMNFDGFIIESHCNPEEALSDAAQQLTPTSLSAILNSLVIPDQTHTTESLDLLRKEIDRLDTELLELLSRRMSVARDIGKFKKEHRMSVVQPGRYNDLMQQRVNTGVSLDMSEDFIRNILAAIHEESVRQQLEI